MRCILATIAVLTFALSGQPRAEPTPTLKLADCAWLAGVWRSGPDQKTALEEHWSAPANGAMMGMFRMLTPGRPALYEFLLLEETAEGVIHRIRHYGPEMADRDKAPIRARLTAATDKRLEFTAVESESLKRLIYERNDAGGLTATVETTRNGQPAKFTLKMVRGEAK